MKNFIKSIKTIIKINPTKKEIESVKYWLDLPNDLKRCHCPFDVMDEWNDQGKTGCELFCYKIFPEIEERGECPCSHYDAVEFNTNYVVKQAKRFVRWGWL